MIFFFYFQLNIDDLMQILNAMEKSMVRFCFQVCVLILYSYLMGVDTIDQTIYPEVLGMTKCSIA